MLIKLKNLVLHSNTGADAIQKAPIVNYDTGIRCARVGDFSNNRDYHNWGFCKVDQDIYNQYKLIKDDIIVTRTASLGLCKIIESNINAVYNNGIIRLKCDKSKIIPKFLYYVMQSDKYFGYIQGIEGGSSTRPNMKINFLLDYSFELPKFDIQQHIVNSINCEVKYAC